MTIINGLIAAIGAKLFVFGFIIVLIILLLVSILGNVGIDWKEKRFTFGSHKNKSRTCPDCIKLFMGKRLIFEGLYNSKYSLILRQQMVFAEHKLSEIEIILKTEIHSKVKDEIRRSFKENGFQEMNKTDYSKYINERTETLLTLLNSSDATIPSIIKEIYDNAKSVKARIDLELSKLEKDFETDINKLIVEPK